MCLKGKEPIDLWVLIPLSSTVKKPQLLYNYFKQLFAQVTNPIRWN